MASVANIVRFLPASGSTGDFVYSSGVTGYRTPVSSPALTDGATYRYRAESSDLSEWEVGEGTWTTATTTMARTTIIHSSTGAKVNFTVAPNVAIVALADQFVNPAGDTMTGSLVVPNASGIKIKDTDASHTLGLVGGSNLTSDRTLTLTTGDADRVLDISAGNVTISAAGAALVDDADAAAQRATLGLGTAATKSTGTSGNVIPLLDGANIFSAGQKINTNASTFPASLTSGVINLMAADTTASLINLVSFAANSNFTQARAGGTAASPSALASGDMIGQNVFKGYDGSAWGSNQVTIRSYATEAWTSSAHGSDLRFGTTANGATTVTDRCRVDQDGTFRPAADNTYNIGSASYRWKEVFAATGSINTSDARHKTPVRAMSPAEIATAKALSKEIGIFQFLDSVTKKGSDKARLHTGMTVQRIIEIFDDNGLDPFRYAFVCFDKWGASFERVEAVVDGEGNIIEPEAMKEFPAGEIYGLRSDQLLMFIARGFEERLTALEAV